MLLLMFLLGLIVGLAWGAGGILLLQELPKRKIRSMDRKTDYILFKRMRGLRDEALN